MQGVVVLAPTSAQSKSVTRWMWGPDRSRSGLLVSDGCFQPEPLVIPRVFGHQVLDCPHHAVSSVKGALVQPRGKVHNCTVRCQVLIGMMGSMRLPSEFPDMCLSTSCFLRFGCNSVEVRLSGIMWERKEFPLSLCVVIVPGSVLYLTKTLNFSGEDTLSHPLAGLIRKNWKYRQIHWPHTVSHMQHGQTLGLKAWKLGIFPQLWRREY